MVFRWQADDGPIKAVFGSFILPSTKKKSTKKLYQIWTPSDKTSGSPHGLVFTRFCRYRYTRNKLFAIPNLFKAISYIQHHHFIKMFASDHHPYGESLKLPGIYGQRWMSSNIKLSCILQEPTTVWII